MTCSRGVPSHQQYPYQLAQGLHAIHIAELADVDAWEMLIELAEGPGQTQLVPGFREAAAAEQRHLMMVRGWLRAHTMGEAGAKVA